MGRHAERGTQEPGDGAFAALLRGARGGDPDCIARLWTREIPLVRGILRRGLPMSLRRLYDTADLTQSVVTELLRDLPRIEDRGEPAFHRLVSLKARSKLGEKIRRVRRGGARAEKPAPEAAVEGAVARELSPRSANEQAEARARIRAAMSRLDGATRAVVDRRMDGRSFGEIAHDVGLPSADAARKRYAKALVALRGVL